MCTCEIVSILDKLKCLILHWDYMFGITGPRREFLGDADFLGPGRTALQLFANPRQWGRNRNPWESIVAPELTQVTGMALSPIECIMVSTHCGVLDPCSHLNGVGQMLSSCGVG